MTKASRSFVFSYDELSGNVIWNCLARKAYF
jgi:hypothetical protein